MVSSRTELIECILCARLSYVIESRWSSVTDPLRTPLSWRLRLQIAAGVAAALVSSLTLTTLSLDISQAPQNLLYTHTQNIYKKTVKLSLMQEYLLLFTNPPMCHVSISSSTIILDENFTAKVPK